MMTPSGILLNNALSNFEIPSSSSDGGGGGGNGLSGGRRPLSPAVAAIAIDAEEICGQRIIVGGATADSVGEVRKYV